MIVERVAGSIAAAVSIHALYPPNHPRVVQSIDQIINALQQYFVQTQEEFITYLLVGDDLIVNEEVIRKTTLTIDEFIAIMRQRGFERLTFENGLTVDEALLFVGAFATGKPLPALAHIIVGSVRVVMEEEKQEDRERHKPLSVEQLEVVRSAWARFRVERRLPVDQLEELVWSLIDSIGSTTRAMLPLANLKSHDEYTYVHSVNVSLLVLAQARSYGIWGPMLHAFGMAALLHDVGKLMIPVSILNKPGKLELDEWEIMKTHCREGAWYLGEMENTTPLSVVVAYEHHFRYDGQPNYPRVRKSRIPNLASRMTAIADTYDAMMTVRPYQQPLGRAAAFEVLRKRSNTFFDPMVVGNFIRLMDTGTAPQS